MAEAWSTHRVQPRPRQHRKQILIIRVAQDQLPSLVHCVQARRVGLIRITTTMILATSFVVSRLHKHVRRPRHRSHDRLSYRMVRTRYDEQKGL